jgi:acyl carrier protein
MSTFERINNCIDELVGIKATSEDQNLTDDLHMDSLDVLEFVIKLEDEFVIVIPDEDWEGGQIKTVKQVVEYIDKRLIK